jgi:hypothetical protein
MNSAVEGEETIVLKTLGMQHNGKKAVKPRTHHSKILRREETNISNVEGVVINFIIVIT